MRVYHDMKWSGLLLWCTGCVRLHKDGDSFGFVFRAWHPLTWLTMAVMILPCALLGESLLQVVPLKLSRFWQLNLDQLQRVTPFTDKQTLRPFNHSKAVRTVAPAP